MSASAEILLPARRRFDLRELVLGAGYDRIAPFRWRGGRHPRLAWAETLPNRRIYLLVVRGIADGVALRATGERADEVEQLASLAARVRRALWLDLEQPGTAGRQLRSPRATTLFEDCVKLIAGDAPAIEALGALGRRCPARRALRTFPDAHTLARLGPAHLRARAPLAERAGQIVALASASARGLVTLGALERSGLSRVRLERTLARVPGLDASLARRLMPLLDRLPDARPPRLNSRRGGPRHRARRG